MRNYIIMNNNSLDKYTGSTAEGIQQITDILVEQGGDLPESLEMLGMKHSFTDGIYAREMTIPKDTMVVGKIHKHRHHNFLTKGSIIVVTEEGGVELLQAPMMVVSEPGTQRIGYAITETIWTCVHKNEDNIEDLELLEEINVVDTPQQYLEYKEQLKIQ